MHSYPTVTVDYFKEWVYIYKYILKIAPYNQIKFATKASTQSLSAWIQFDKVSFLG